MAIVIFVVLMLVSEGFGKSNIVVLDCQPAVGTIGEKMKINCSIKINANVESQDYEIYNVRLTKKGQKDPDFLYSDGSVTGDTRFTLPSQHDPSLMLYNVSLSHEGEYIYWMFTSRGMSETRITVNVTTPYNLTINSWPEKHIENEPFHLYCNASGGYPAATIQWYDAVNTNRTKDANLQITKGNDGLFELSSKLSFLSFDPMWGKIRCVVINKYSQASHEIHVSGPPVARDGNAESSSKPKNFVAPLVVIGSLIAGLLIVLIYTQRRRRQRNRRPSTLPILREVPRDNNTDVEDDDTLNELMP